MTVTNNLDIEQVLENQASPEVSVNDATLALGMALTEIYTADVTSGNVVITAADYKRAMRFKVTGATSAGRTVTLGTTVPKRGITIFEIDVANTQNASLVCGATTATLKPGHLYVVSTDGTVDGLVAIDVGNTLGEAADLHIFCPATWVNGQLVYRQKVTRAFTLPINLTGSYVTANTAATGSTTATLKKNGSSIGTAVWSASGTVAVLTFAAAVSFAVGDVFTIEGPATADATLADVSLDLYASR